jgi:hypothetical protein
METCKEFQLFLTYKLVPLWVFTQIWKPYLLLGNPYKNVAIISMTDSTIKVYNNGVAYWHPAGNINLKATAVGVFKSISGLI